MKMASHIHYKNKGMFALCMSVPVLYSSESTFTLSTFVSYTFMLNVGVFFQG